MVFVFRPEHMIGLANGTLKQVVSSSGIPLSMVRDAATGQIVGHAVGIVSQPLVAIPQVILDGVQMYRGFQKTYNMIDDGFQKTYNMINTLQNNVAILQTTTALIGVGTVAGVVLSAVNLYQTLKLREDIKQLKFEVKNGFIDLKTVLKNQGTEIINRIDQVANDIKYEQHRLILIQAYGRFQQALILIKTALKCEEINIRNATFANAQLMLSNALADYQNPHLLQETSAAGYLRRLECSWIIEQAFALTYQFQNQSSVVSDRLAHLQYKIRQDCLTVIERCESNEELNFLFPEIARICNHDLVILESWQNHVDWLQTLSVDERHDLANAYLQSTDDTEYQQESGIINEPEELLLYSKLKQKSHYLSLRDQLRFMIKSDLRISYESYIKEKAVTTGYTGFASADWQEIPDLTVANLYWYLKEIENSK